MENHLLGHQRVKDNTVFISILGELRLNLESVPQKYFGTCELWNECRCWSHVRPTAKKISFL